MRLPIILALAVILLTPANIREVLIDATSEARALAASVLDRNIGGETLEVAEATTLKTRHDTAKNSVNNLR